MGSELPEEAMERLGHLEQLVVQLKELIRDKDTQLLQKDTELTSKDAQLKVSKPLCVFDVSESSHAIFCVLFCFVLQNERDEAEARFTKLKLQAKAKMASLTKQITELKGQGAAMVSFSG